MVILSERSESKDLSLLLGTRAGLGAYLDWEAWEMVEMMRRLARTR